MPVRNVHESKESRVDAIFKDYNLSEVPGASVMVIQNGKILYKKAFGFSELESKRKNTPSTNYRLASLTKQFTAMAIMILAREKKLKYGSHLSDFFPGFPSYGKQITVAQLLNHTSGLKDYEDLIPEGTIVPLKDKQVLELLSNQSTTLFTPGSRFRYSNSGYAILALIVEKVSGVSFAEFLRINIFHPLKMDNTIAFENGISTVSNRAYGYALNGEKFELKDQSLTSSVLGDGGIYSSVEDLYKWDQALYTSKLINRQMLSEAFSRSVATQEEGVSYGYGWFVETYHGLKTVWHYGSTVGFGTAIERFPEKNFTVIVLINRDNADGHKIAREIVDIYLFNESN